MTLLPALVGGPEIFSRRVRQLGGLWVVVSIPFITATSALVVDGAGSYVFVFVFLSSGAFTAPALGAIWYASSRVEHRFRPGVMLAFAGLVAVVVIGVAMLIGLATGWHGANPAGVPAVALAGLLHNLGLMTWTRLRSGGRAFSVDVIEGVTAVLALTAPLVVLWGPAVAEAEAGWFAFPAAVAIVCTIASTYWALVLFVRLGPARGPVEAGVVVLTGLGAVNAALQTAQGVTGFQLPAPPLIALNSLCFSMYLLTPLYAPAFLRSGLDRLPPQSQVRGARLATVVTLTGLTALWISTLAAPDTPPWAVTFSFVVVSLLLALACVRHMAATQETRRLYRQVEEASDERRRLLTRLLERSVDDRRRFATELYTQAVTAYASFNMMAVTSSARVTSASALAEASARIGDDLARHARSVQELARAIRPLEGERDPRDRLGIPIHAYLTTIYGDRTPPRLTIDIEAKDDLALDWTTETAVLQIAQEAVHNVWRHSHATTVDITIHAAGPGVVLRVADDGIGFDPAAVPEGPGIATMRAAASVADGTLAVESRPGQGTTVVAHLRAADHQPSPTPSGPKSPILRLVRDHDTSDPAPPDQP
jgi:signal transduction histidine kinase